MGKALIKGTISGAIIVFIWMMLSWMVIPWHCAVMSAFTDPAKVSSVIMENTTDEGIYVLPSFCDATNMEAHTELMKKGPVIFASVQRYGFDVDSAAPYILSFITQLIGAFLVTYLLLLAKQKGYWRGVWFVTLIGLTVGVIGSLPYWNWWGFTLGFVGVEILDLVISWFLAGLAISAFCRHAVKVDG